jgi:hypothetical protein
MKARAHEWSVTMSTLSTFHTQTSIVFAATQTCGIRQRAEHRLRNSAYAPLRTLSCDYHEGVLTLRGRLPSHYLKQIAQVLMDGLDGVLEIANRVDVVCPDARLHRNID